MTVATSTPKATASARPTTTAPRTTTRTRQSNAIVNQPVRSQASRMNGAPNLPSRLVVTSRMGMRISDGNRPK
jgi:hypothetical protein